MLTGNPRTWARALWLWGRCARHLTNWPEVYANYMSGRALPELHLRNGVVLSHARNDAPVLLLFEVFADGVYRKHLPAARRGMVVDIGSNIGAAAIDFSHRHPGVVVHAYEPNPATRETLMRNIEGNRLETQVTVFGDAVGRATGSLRLWVDGPSVVATAYSESAPFPGCKALEVPVIGLDECLERAGAAPVLLLKIDAEGAEADILEGAAPAGFERIGNVALEYHNDLCPKADERCAAVLKRAGYHCERVPAREPHRGMIYSWRK